MKFLLMYYLSLIIPTKWLIKQFEKDLTLTVGYFMYLAFVWRMIIYLTLKEIK